MPTEIQELASDRHVNVEGLNRSLLLLDKAMGAMLGYIKYYFSYMMVISVLQ